ncbi:MAG: hypothetical protein E6Q36_10030 [Chryseobacterium sp.]|nr:MAG: hypothetical protein E6Q36_10030 [Chryseobacterium sp.]
MNIKQNTEVVKQKTQEDEAEEEKLIQIKIRRFTKTEQNWWAKFGLDMEDLKKQKDVKVYSVDKYWIDKELKFNNLMDEFCFAYHFETIDKFKIYKPLSDKRKGETKWISNVPLKTMYGLDNIKNCEKAIIAKSFKDLAVINKIYPCVCGTQNEALASISDENLEFIRSNAKESYIAFDSDEPGKKASWSVTKALGLKHLNTPDALLKFGVNDFAGWAERDGIDMVEYFLKLKGFI